MALFPAGLVACIAEARTPSDQELRAVAEHIWNDAFGHVTGRRWDGLGDDDGRRLWMIGVARHVLRGAPCAACAPGPDYPTALEAQRV